MFKSFLYVLRVVIRGLRVEGHVLLKNLPSLRERQLVKQTNQRLKVFTYGSQRADHHLQMQQVHFRNYCEFSIKDWVLVNLYKRWIWDYLVSFEMIRLEEFVNLTSVQVNNIVSIGQ